MIPNIICCKLNKNLLRQSHDVIIVFTYIHPQNSKWYKKAETCCDITVLDTCLSDLIEKYKDVYFIVCGDMSSRVGESNPCATVTVTVTEND